MKTLLQIVRATCQVLALPQPGSVIGNSDPRVAQMLGLMEELLTDLEMREWWQNTIREATFTSFAQEDQGFISTIADEGFVQFIPDTFFDRTTNLKVTTGLRPDEWQAIQAGPGSAGPFYMARIRNDRLLLSPAPPSGDTMAFEYQSRYFIEASPYVPPVDEDPEVPATYTGSWTNDTHKLVGPDGLGPAWLKFAWKREKGLDYAEDQVTYENILATVKIRDNAPRPLHMDETRIGYRAGVVVPAGNWSMS